MEFLYRPHYNRALQDLQACGAVILKAFRRASHRLFAVLLAMRSICTVGLRGQSLWPVHAADLHGWPALALDESRFSEYDESDLLFIR
ncbi:MAG: hypothetical protein IJK56_05755 [Firmicutes bacterium]|nr:hypothetical protein [Bacillota bacterium]